MSSLPLLLTSTFYHIGFELDRPQLVAEPLRQLRDGARMHPADAQPERAGRAHPVVRLASAGQRPVIAGERGPTVDQHLVRPQPARARQLREDVRGRLLSWSEITREWNKSQGRLVILGVTSPAMLGSAIP